MVLTLDLDWMEFLRHFRKVLCWMTTRLCLYARLHGQLISRMLYSLLVFRSLLCTLAVVLIVCLAYPVEFVSAATARPIRKQVALSTLCLVCVFLRLMAVYIYMNNLYAAFGGS